jgi:hypothetical protein
MNIKKNKILSLVELFFCTFKWTLLKGIYPKLIAAIIGGWLTIILSEEYWRISILTEFNSLELLLIKIGTIFVLFVFVHDMLKDRFSQSFRRTMVLYVGGLIWSFVIGFILFIFVFEIKMIESHHIMEDKIFQQKIIKKAFVNASIESCKICEDKNSLLLSYKTDDSGTIFLELKFQDLGYTKILCFKVPYIKKIFNKVIYCPSLIFGSFLALFIGIFLNILLTKISNII